MADSERTGPGLPREKTGIGYVTPPNGTADQAWIETLLGGVK